MTRNRYTWTYFKELQCIAVTFLGQKCRKQKCETKAPGLLSGVEAPGASGEKWKCSPYNGADGRRASDDVNLNLNTGGQASYPATSPIELYCASGSLPGASKRH